MKWFQTLKEKLHKSSNKFNESLKSVLSKNKIDDQSLEDLREILIRGDVGYKFTNKLIDKIKNKSFEKKLDEIQVKKLISDEIENILKPLERDISFQDIEKKNLPYVIIIIGVNGSGKTTTIGKLSHMWSKKYKVRLAACDTFRAGAKEQLVNWANRSGIPIVTGDAKSDPASVAYKSLQISKKERDDILIIDTAGRLQNKIHLMEELSKIVRVLKKQDLSIPNEILLVLDATVGQNSYSQITSFNKVAPLTGIIITKLDGTAKAGSIINLSETYKIPITYIGVGESIEDIQKFSAKEFSNAIVT